MINIYQTNETGIPFIQHIANNTWPDTFGNILSTEQISYMLFMMYDHQALLKQMKELGHVFLLAKFNNETVGFASYELNYKGEPNIKLHKIYILPEMHGKKIGQHLVNEVAGIGRAAGQTGLLLNVNRHNNAVGFYERVGFSVIGEEDIDIGNGFFMNDVIMRMPL
ncbi:GNAT family N-acetyltransferase [Chitinophaga horti]|uniref:GNAT family N-acetyltransferase n=1 Tax=Chitinophaga horti TaxID=2920382 RepID=A0ABY6IZM6_9BACT|nr:GNAT family N-acetyltransferase [Chitinophaga horti]UYQ92868.1 GNAT family N-acetyltransferase [Chitinophaga horti]